MNDILNEISVLSRKGTDSIKWDGLRESFQSDGLLPMWVADMDFKAPLCVREALHRAVDQGVFGYYKVPDRYYDAIINWEVDRHDYHLERSWMRTTSGVVSGLHHLINAITVPKDGIMIQTPVYYPFFRLIERIGRRLVCQPLVNNNGYYTVDLKAFERTLVEKNVKVFLLCSPHNPVGRVWTRKELQGMLDACRRNKVQVISDEIHQDLTMPGYNHIPAATLWKGSDSLRPITIFAASKTFNLAAMKNSVLVIPSEETRAKFDTFEKSLGTPPGSALDYVAVTAAYEAGEGWLDTVLAEVHANYELLKNALAQFPDVTVSPLEGTYLAWIDLAPRINRFQLHPLVQKRCALAPDYGYWFYPDSEESDDCHIRLNLATPRANVREAVDRLVKALIEIKEATED